MRLVNDELSSCLEDKFDSITWGNRIARIGESEQKLLFRSLQGLDSLDSFRNLEEVGVGGRRVLRPWGPEARGPRLFFRSG